MRTARVRPQVTAHPGPQEVLVTSPGVVRHLLRAPERGQKGATLWCNGNGPTSSTRPPAAGCKHPEEVAVTRHLSLALGSTPCEPRDQTGPLMAELELGPETGGNPVPADAGRGVRNPGPGAGELQHGKSRGEARRGVSTAGPRAGTASENSTAVSPGHSAAKGHQLRTVKGTGREPAAPSPQDRGECPPPRTSASRSHWPSRAPAWPHTGL